MLVTGKTRLYTVSFLVFVVFIFLTLNYNPQLPDDSASTLRQWAKTSTEQLPAWIGNKAPGSHPPIQELPFTPEPPDHNELHNANPDPYAAIGGVTGDVGKMPEPPTPPSPPSMPAEPTESEEPAESDAAEQTEKEKQQDYVKDHMGVPLTLGSQPFSSPDVDKEDIAQNYHEIASSMTPDGSYSHLDFVHYQGFNPSLIPHPRKDDTWLMTAQHMTGDRGYPSGWSAEITCEVQYQPDKGNNMSCIGIPVHLAVGATRAPKGPEGCPENISTLHMNIGPHDARVFFGPRFPYIMYGTQSQFRCFGQWAHDFRMVYDWGHFRNYSDPFDAPTEIQRPGSYGPMEKNYFLFFDMEDQFHAHYDTAPQRSYAKIADDGAAGPDLAIETRTHDEKCWGKHLSLNPLPPKSEAKSSIHQATNSLSVTMCERRDPSCKMTPENTYVIQIYQHKIGNGIMHARYEPYVMVFKRTSPFEMHAISSKPIWIRGRTSKAEMIYVTSINWKLKDLNYHGFLDDIIFMGFGVEDKRTGAIDISAKDLLGDLMLCDD